MKHDLTKRFWVFEFHNHYPSGGVDDVIGTFDLESDAYDLVDKRKTDQHPPDHIQVVDTKRGTVHKQRLITSWGGGIWNTHQT